MTDNVEKFTAKPGSTAVEIATEILQAAHNGSISCLAVAYIHTDGDVVFTVSKHDQFYKLLGAVDGLKFAMLKAYQV